MQAGGAVGSRVPATCEAVVIRDEEGFEKLEHSCVAALLVSDAWPALQAWHIGAAAQTVDDVPEATLLGFQHTFLAAL
jgi:hypothetical protein